MKFFFLTSIALFFSMIVQSHLVKAPKRAKSIVKQCQDQGFDGACNVKHMVDVRGICPRPIRCAVKLGKKHFSQAAKIPNEGTPCGKNKICRNLWCCNIDANDAMPIVEGSARTVKCHGMVPFTDRIEIDDFGENDVI